MNAFELFAKITLDTSGFDSELNKAKGLASSVGSGISKVMDVGMKAVAGATAAVGAFGATSVKTGLEFDSSMSQVAATMGQKANEMVEYDGQMMKSSEALREFALKEGRETAFSASQAADALNYMALAGYDANTSIQMLPNVLNLAAAGNFDLARASDMVTDTQSAFGISLERTTQMVDEMARASSTGNTSVEQLGDAFLTVGGLAQELNGGFVYLNDGTEVAVDGIQELEIALTAMANSGIKGSEAGTHMRNMLLKLSSPTSDGTKALEAMGVTVFDTEGKMRSLADVFVDLGNELDNMSQEEKIQTISDLFNTRDLASAEALLGAVQQDWDKIGESILGASEAGVMYQGKIYSMEEAQAKFGDAIYDTDKGFRVLGAAEVMAATQLDNLKGDMTLFGSALEGTQIALSDKLTPTLRGFVQDATQGLSEVAAAITEGNWDGATDAIGKFLSNSLNTIVEGLPQFIDAGMQVLGALGQGIIDNIPTIVDSGVQIVVQLTNGLVQALPQLAEGAITLVQSLGQSFSENAPQLLDAGMQLVQMIADGIVSGIPILIEQGLPMLVDFSAGLREHAGDLVDAGIDLIMKIADGLIEGLPTMIETIPDIIINIAGVINDNAPKLLVAGVELIGKLGMGIIKAIPTLVANIPKIFEAILAVWSALNWISLGTNLINFISDGVKSLAENIPNALKDIGNKAVEFFKGIDWKNLGQTIINFIKDGITALTTTIPEALKSIGNSAMEAFKGIDWASVGKNVIDGIANGIKNAAGIIADAAKNAAKAAFEAAKDFLGIHSPSRLMRDQVGRFISEGIAVGIEDNLNSITNSMNDVADLVSQPIDVGEVGMTGGSGSGSAYNSSNSVVINVYGAVGQNVNELAEIVSRKINASVSRRGAAWA